MRNGDSNPYQLEESISNLRVVVILNSIRILKVNSVSLIIRRSIWRVIGFFIVCRCPIKRTLGLYGLKLDDTR